jgi:hypothetical protein
MKDANAHCLRDNPRRRPGLKQSIHGHLLGLSRIETEDFLAWLIPISIRASLGGIGVPG